MMCSKKSLLLLISPGGNLKGHAALNMSPEGVRVCVLERSAYVFEEFVSPQSRCCSRRSHTTAQPAALSFTLYFLIKIPRSDHLKLRLSFFFFSFQHLWLRNKSLMLSVWMRLLQLSAFFSQKSILSSSDSSLEGLEDWDPSAELSRPSGRILGVYVQRIALFGEDAGGSSCFHPLTAAHRRLGLFLSLGALKHAVAPPGLIGAAVSEAQSLLHLQGTGGAILRRRCQTADRTESDTLVPQSFLSFSETNCRNTVGNQVQDGNTERLRKTLISQIRRVDQMQRQKPEVQSQC